MAFPCPLVNLISLLQSQKSLLWRFPVMLLTVTRNGNILDSHKIKDFPHTVLRLTENFHLLEGSNILVFRPLSSRYISA